MSINKENYIEYFLLYTDNELSFSERKEVEDFVALYPELKDELNALQLTILPVDDQHYEPITELTKFNGLTIQPELLLHLDDELKGKEKSEVVALIQTDKVVAEEWNILQSVKLKPETVVFEHKELLYRKTRRPNVIPMPFRMVAAALLVGVGFFIGMEHSKDSIEPSFGLPQEPVVKIHTNESVQENIKVETSKDGVDEFVAEPELSAKEIKSTPTNSVITKSNELVVDKNNFKKNDNGSNILNVSSVQSVENPPVFIPEEVSRTSITSIVTNDNVPVIRERRNPYAFTAQNDQIQEEEPVISESNKEEKKQGGFFKKVKRVIEKKTNMESDGNLLIGAFEIAIR